MNLDEPSPAARALARSYIDRTIRRMQGRQGPGELNQPPHVEAVRTSVDRLADTYTEDYAPGNPPAPRAAPGGDTCAAQPINPPLHDHFKSDSVSHYLTTNLETDQGVGERYDGCRDVVQMEARIVIEKKRLEALRQTRRQLDRRNTQTHRESRQHGRAFNHTQHLPQRSHARDNAARAARSAALAQSLERERSLLAKARQRGTVAATASLVTTSGLAGTASNYAADRIERSAPASRTHSELSRMLDEQRAALAADRAKRKTEQSAL